MFKDLDNRTQLAIALMATDKVYTNWMRNRGYQKERVSKYDNYTFYLLKQELNFTLWRKGSDCGFVGILMKYQPLVRNQPEGHCYISVENYFRGIAKDTLELNKPNATFEDYLKLANNFPEKSVTLTVKGLFECFESVGLLPEFTFFVGVATNLLYLNE